MVLLQKLEAWEYDPDSVDHDERSEHRYCPNRPVPPQTLQGSIYFGMMCLEYFPMLTQFTT